MADIQDTLVFMHSLIRWIILSLALVGAARSFVSALSVSGRFARLDVGLSNAFAGVMDLQGAVGVLLVISALIMQRPVPWIHPVIMVPAIIVAHQNRRFRDAPDRRRHQAQLGIFLGSLALVAVGLLVIGQLYLPGQR